MKALLNILGLVLFWICPLSIVTIIANIALMKAYKARMIKRHHILNAMYLSLWTIVLIYAFMMIESKITDGYADYYKHNIMLLIAFILASPVILAVQTSYINVSTAKRIQLSLINSTLLFFANDFITTYFMVLPMHRRYFLFDLLGI